MQKWQCRIAPSLGGGFSGTPNECWGTMDYINDKDPAVFFGMYGFPDFYALWRHKGKKAILWAGSDITNFINGYWLEEGGGIKMSPWPLALWIDKYCDNYCENEVERKALSRMGIIAKVIPSFLGDVNDYKVCFKPGNKLYTSVSGDDYAIYGWDKIVNLADANPHIEFHLYGNSKPFYSVRPNIIDHGRVSQKRMNSEIKYMQGAIRMTEFDGCSELIVKAILNGLYAFSSIDYPGIHSPQKIHLLTTFKTANIAYRDWWIKNLNQYPWNEKIAKHN